MGAYQSFLTSPDGSNTPLEVLRLAASVASAVNYVQITNAATGNGPILEAAGTDTNIDLNLKPKGTGSIAANSAKITSLAAGSASGEAVSYEQIANALGLGSGYPIWYPCTFYFAPDDESGNPGVTCDSTNIANYPPGNSYWYFSCPQPFNRGTLTFRVTGVRVNVVGANATNYITAVNAHAISGTTDNTILSDTTDRTAAGTYDYTFNAVNLGGYHALSVIASIVAADSSSVVIAGVMVRGYYA
jgi:hypothetical protein